MAEKVYIQETPEQTEALDEVMTLIAVVTKEFVPEVDPYNLPLDTPARELFDNNVEVFGIALAKLHLYFDLEIPYKPYSEFEEFDNLEDVFQYFGDRVLEKRGLW